MFLDPHNEAKAVADLERYVEKTCKPIAIKHRLLISVSEAKLVDIIASARATAEFHHIDPSKISRYKEYAHIGYWIIRHKPISIITPYTKKKLMNDAFNTLKSSLKKSISGFDVRIIDRVNRDTEDAYKTDVEKYREKANDPINEQTALWFIWDHCEMGWDQQLKDLETHDKEKAEMFQHRIQALKDRYHSDSFGDLVWSMRYHSFTPRAFASFIEAMLKVDIQ
jgi:hypothetical protein